MCFGGGVYLVGGGHSGTLTLLQAEEVGFFPLSLFEKERSKLSSAEAAGQSLACLRSQSLRRGNSGGPRTSFLTVMQSVL